VSTPLRIVVGITGGIAAYKAVSVIRQFVKDGHFVEVIATEAALQFVGRPTLEAISRNAVYTSVYDDVAQVRHVAMGQRADVIVVAPATANSIAQFAAGLAPDLLGNTVLARRCPLVLAPAMHTEMWENPATVENIQTLRDRGVLIVGPGNGKLTGDDTGIGRMSEPEEIVAATYSASVEHPRSADRLPAFDLEGRRILISGGGTREPIDPVRFIGNRSTGTQAVSLAARAAARGAYVTLVAANLEVEAPVGINVTRVSTTAELRDAMLREQSAHDVVIMAAAVADYRPAIVSESKLKKDAVGEQLTIEMIQNPDVLLELVNAKPMGQIVVGFAAETAETPEELVELGRTKIARKKCDFLVLNRVGWDEGFGKQGNSVTVLSQAGDIVETAAGSKLSVADVILEVVAR
jgi:phosphopantothenoylcysteine decarboxylase/phosphopantothenate--cysteine ligase